MKVLLVFPFLLLSSLMFGQKSSHFGAAKFSPEDGKKLLIIGQDLAAVGGLTEYTSGYVNELGQIPAGVTTYTGFPGVAGLRTKTNWGAGDIHAQAYSEESTFDNTAIVIGLHLVGQLSTIKNGYADNDLEFLGQWIKEQHRPVFLRVGYEFDGPWNNYDPTLFKNAWVYIVKYFDTMDIRNVAYVWQAAGINTANIDRWYPGDEYVNWVAYSHFDESNPGQNIRDFAAGHAKPVMIAESTPRRNLSTADGATVWTTWFAPLFAKIYSNNRIKALAYINANWESQSMWQGQGWGDSRVQVNTFIKSAWQTEMAKDYWLNADNNLFITLKYQEWIDDETVTSAAEKESEAIQVINNGDNIVVKSSSQKPLLGIQLLDLTGKELYSELTPGVAFVISTDGIPQESIFVLKVITASRILVQKIALR